MRNNSAKNVHTAVKERWPNRNRFQTETGGEIWQMRIQLETLLKEVSRKHLRAGELLKLKSRESINLHTQFKKAFKKHAGPEAQRALAKMNATLANHLRGVERELGATRSDITRLSSKAQTLAKLLRTKA